MVPEDVADEVAVGDDVDVVVMFATHEVSSPAEIRKGGDWA